MRACEPADRERIRLRSRPRSRPPQSARANLDGNKALEVPDVNLNSLEYSEADEFSMSTRLVVFEACKDDPHGSATMLIYQTSTFAQPSATHTSPLTLKHSIDMAAEPAAAASRKQQKTAAPASVVPPLSPPRPPPQPATVSETVKFPTPYEFWEHLDRLITLVNDARTSIAICMYVFSLKELVKAVIAANASLSVGTFDSPVRIILDYQQMRSSLGLVRELLAAEIPVKVHNRRIFMMHSKYTLIDRFKRSSFGSLALVVRVTSCGSDDELMWLVVAHSDKAINGSSCSVLIGCCNKAIVFAHKSICGCLFAVIAS